jgi:hypothetical protein
MLSNNVSSRGIGTSSPCRSGRASVVRDDLLDERAVVVEVIGSRGRTGRGPEARLNRPPLLRGHLELPVTVFFVSAAAGDANNKAAPIEAATVREAGSQRVFVVRADRIEHLPVKEGVDLQALRRFFTPAAGPRRSLLHDYAKI